MEERIHSNSFNKTNPRESGVAVYSISNAKDLSAEISNYGLRILSLHTPDSHGKLANIVLGFNQFEDYKSDAGMYFGCIVGPFANRIQGASFQLNDSRIFLEKNEGENHVHGGANGYHNAIWELVEQDSNKLKFQKLFTEKQTGYPGNVLVEVSYTLHDSNALEIAYQAKSDKDTIISPTNHSYFNLQGEGQGSIQDHFVTINASKVLFMNDDLIPEQMVKVENTPFDLRVKKQLRDSLESKHPQFEITRGFDHCYVLKNNNDDNMQLAAIAEDPISGRVLKVLTTTPGVQLYTGNFLDGSLTGKSGKTYEKHAGFCLETQQFPNAPNRADFPSAQLTANTVYTSKTIYQFSTNIQLKNN